MHFDPLCILNRLRLYVSKRLQFVSNVTKRLSIETTVNRPGLSSKMVDELEYTQFVSMHQGQLTAAQIPQYFWRILHAKLKNEVNLFVISIACKGIILRNYLEPTCDFVLMNAPCKVSSNGSLTLIIATSKHSFSTMD